jgi:transcriptional regulator with XRE-family HTH domain
MNHLAERVGPDGIKFQQIQKYECGANRVTSSRLYELALAMDVPVAYFFEGYNGAEVSERVALDRTEKLRGSIGESISSGMSVEAVLAVALEVSASLKK